MIKDNLERLFVTGLFGMLGVSLAIVQCGAIVLSLMEIPITQITAMAILLLAGGAGLWWLLGVRIEVKEWGTDSGNPLRQGWVMQWVEWGIIALGLVVFAFMLYLGYVSRDLTCDGNGYHIPVINYWIRHGGIYWVNAGTVFDYLFNGYPKGVETVAYIVAQATDSGRPWNGVNLLFLPLGVLGVTILSRTLGASRLSAMAVGFVFILIPVNLFQVQTFYVDTAFASCAIAMLAAFSLIQDVLPGGPGRATKFVLLGVMTGLTLSIKGTSVIFVGVCYLMALGRIIVMAYWPSIEKGRSQILAEWLMLMGAGLLGLMIGGFWYIRNWILQGNPLWPFEVIVGGVTFFPGLSLTQLVPEYPPYGQIPLFGQIVLNWFQGVTLWPNSMRGVDSRYGGFGFLWVIACLPAIGLGIFAPGRRVPPILRLRLWMLVLVCLGAFLLMPLKWYARFTVWIYALGLPFLAMWVTRECERPGLRFLKIWLTTALLIMMGEALFSVFLLTRWDIWPGAWPVHSVEILNKRSWIWPNNYLFPETEGTIMDEILKNRCAVAVGPLETITTGGRYKNNMLTALSLPLGYRDVVGVSGKLVAADIERLNKLKVKYIVWDDQKKIPDSLPGEEWSLERVPGFWVMFRARQFAGDEEESGDGD